MSSGCNLLIAGTCNSTTGQCDCEEGWTGDMCDEEEKNECEGIVCQNGG